MTTYRVSFKVDTGPGRAPCIYTTPPMEQPLRVVVILCDTLYETDGVMHAEIQEQQFTWVPVSER